MQNISPLIDFLNWRKIPFALRVIRNQKRFLPLQIIQKAGKKCDIFTIGKVRIPRSVAIGLLQNGMAETLGKKYSTTSTDQLIKIMESGKKNIDDETFELKRRLSKENKSFKFDKNDKILLS